MSLSAVSSLLGLSLFSRALTFGLNTALARHLGPEWFGFSHLQLQLVTSTSLFLAREGIRRACQRIYPGGEEPRQLAHAINLAWLSVPATIISSLGIALYFTPHPEENDPLSNIIPRSERIAAVGIVSLAAVVEACAEPAWIFAQQNLRTPLRALAEASALLARAIMTILLTLSLQMGAIGFGAAQLGYAAVYAVLLYAMLARSRPPSLWPRPTLPRIPEDGRWLSRQALVLGMQYSGQSIQKYLLTEGERLVLIAVSPLAQQGVFALVSNLGSLVARLLLAPVEEVAFASFSRQAATGSLQRETYVQLYALLRSIAIFGGVFVSFGPPYCWLLLHMLYGEKWSSTDAPSVLSAYCFLVGAMGLNGISEAFATATANEEQLRRIWIAMAGLSCVYIPLAALALTMYGSVGLVLANVVNLCSRHAYYVIFIQSAARHHFTRASPSESKAASHLPSVVPHRTVLVSLALSATLTNIASYSFDSLSWSWSQHCAHVGLGGACFLAVAACVMRYERDLIVVLRAARESSKEKS